MAVRRTSSRGSGGRLRIWAVVSSAEVLVRLALQVVTTAVLARLLDPQVFGLSALALSLVTIFAVICAVPFEEALAQRKVVRGAHVRAALGASWTGGVLFLALAVPAGALIDYAFDISGMIYVLPVATLQLFPLTLVVMGTAIARRRRDFNVVAVSSLAGNLAGTVVAIALALMGAGIWALIFFRTVVVLVQGLVLVGLVRFDLRPLWSPPHVRDLSRFAWFVLWDRLVDNLVYLIFNYLVGAVFGLTVLGHFNMAMRVIEPIRGAVMAIGHNLGFSVFMAHAHERARLAEDVRAACRRLTALTAPAFLGLAAVAPLLIPVFAGPGWEESIPMTQLLALGSAFYCATLLVMTALSAAGEPQHMPRRGLIRFAVITLSLIALSPLGAISVGLSRVLADLSDAVVALRLSATRLGLGGLRLAADLARPLIASAAMAALVLGAGPQLYRAVGLYPALFASIGLGAVAYVALLAVLDRPAFSALKGDLLGRGRLAA